MDDKYVPNEDGYYWVRIGKNTMPYRYYIKPDKFTIVRLSSHLDSRTGKTNRYIEFVMSNNRINRLKYFVERAEFSTWIPIQNPNNDAFNLP